MYDHYREKVDSMKNSKRNAQMKGKVFSKSDDEKLSRNEEKLTASQGEYNIARDRAVSVWSRAAVTCVCARVCRLHLWTV